MIALVDFGAGNLSSVRKALAAVGAAVYTPAAGSGLDRATGIVLPGVGHFAATAALDAAWRDALVRASQAGTPLLGICLGMQWLFEGSDEAPSVPGLGLLRGRVVRLPDRDSAGARVKIPHVGWNRLRAVSRSAPIARLLDEAYVYFTHAFVAPVTEDSVAVTEHGVAFTAAVERGPVWGVQFHPEKSGDAGLALLRAFATRCGQTGG